MKRNFIVISTLALIASISIIVAKPSQADLLDFLHTKKDSLTIKGNEVYLNGNQLIKLNGVAMGNPYLRQAKNSRDISDYQAVKNWQANVVRLSVHPGVYKKDEKALKKALKEEVLAARKEGLFVIIDWHVIGFPNGTSKESPNGDYKGVYYDSKMQLAEDFWKYAATEFRDDQGVIFELWNEPFDYNDRKIKWNHLRPYMERLHDVVRSRGAKNIVLASGTFWSYDLTGIKNNPLKGYNIGYVWHTYPSSNGYIPWNKALDQLNDKYPVFLTEWGYSTELTGQHYSLTSKNSDYPEKMKKYIIDNNLNSIAWVWHSSWEPRLLQNDWQTPTSFGTFVKTFLSDISQGKYAAKPKIETAKAAPLIVEDLSKAYQSYEYAFNKKATSQSELADVTRINRGLPPLKRSQNSETKAKVIFNKIYKRQPNIQNKHDEHAVLIIAYGIRQKPENKNPAKEKFATTAFKNIYKRSPSTVWEQNAVQAIAYSGAKK